MSRETEFDRWEERLRKSAVTHPRIFPSAADKSSIPFVDYSSMKLKPGRRKKPRWLEKEGLCFVGCWEILAWRRYSGIATTWEEEDYAFEHSQEFINDVKALGCNAVVLPYDCSHGEEFNEEQVQLTKRFIELLHKNGLKAGTYFRQDIIWMETLSKKELDELDGCFQVDYNGLLIQPFGSAARNICYHHQGALNRFRRHVSRAITDLKTDILHLDGMIIGGHEGDGCRCAKCRDDFRAFLVGRYGHDRKLAESRFGHPFLEKMEVPDRSAPFDSGASRPHWCEWIAFRCLWTSRIMSEVALLAKELNPEVMIEINNALPAVRENAALLTGQDVIGTGFYTDASWSEDAYGPRLHENGLMIQRIRQFKLCRAAGTFGLTYMHEKDERLLRQNLAHTAAFNMGNIGCIGFPPHMNFSNRYNVHFETKCRFMRWLNDNREYFRGTVSDAGIAVWRARENMAISGKLAYAAAMRMEQLLIETCRGFDIVFEEDVKVLEKYDLVIVPNMECMSLRQIEGLLKYVEKGGSILVGQDSGQYDLWHRRRIEPCWSVLFGGKSARNVSADAVAEGIAGVFVSAGTRGASDRITRVTYGKGRAVYMPQVVDPATQPSLMKADGSMDCGLDYTNWVVPEKAKEIGRAIDWLLFGKQAFTVNAKRGMLTEFLVQDNKKRRIVHLVNLGHKPQERCTLDIRIPGIDSIDVISPPTDMPAKWRTRKKGQETQVFLDRIDTYAVVLIEQKL